MKLDQKIKIDFLTDEPIIDSLLRKKGFTPLPNISFYREFNSLVKKNLSSDSSIAMPDTAWMVEYEGSVWNLCKEFQNPPFNELFWEINEVVFILFELRFIVRSYISLLNVCNFYL
jgi:hypothetical protein